MAEDNQNQVPMTRLNDLHERLKEILGSENVYFQPPESLKLSYPCIVYDLSNIRKTTANNDAYKIDKSYTVTLIHTDPDNEIVDRMIMERFAKFDRYYHKDNLHHFVFTFYLRRKQ